METKNKKNILEQSSDSILHSVKKSKNWYQIALLAVVFLLAVGFVYFWQVRGKSNSSDIIASLSNESAEKSKKEGFSSSEKYQAVFLDNGQVYFGKFTSRNAPFYRFENVFYFRQQPQTPQEKKDQDVSLAKLGTELHAPEDFMEINEAHILFIEDLKQDSKVMQAIIKYQVEKK